MITDAWTVAPAAAVIVLALVIMARTLLALSKRVNEHAERIAHIEGFLDQDHKPKEQDHE